MNRYRKDHAHSELSQLAGCLQAKRAGRQAQRPYLPACSGKFDISDRNVSDAW
jgi:hypothetical protein